MFYHTVGGHTWWGVGRKLRAAVHGTFFDELNSAEGCHIVTGLVDLEKFYDNIAIPKLLDA